MGTSRQTSPAYFNPRSPHGERLSPLAPFKFLKAFQSTLSSRRATEWIPFGGGYIDNFNPRSPHGERRWAKTSANVDITISIHALLTESDLLEAKNGQHGSGFQSTLSSRRATPRGSGWRHAPPQFQSTLSSRRATRDAGIGELDFVISIHALLTESDIFPCVI